MMPLKPWSLLLIATALVLVSLPPSALRAEGITILGDLEYLHSDEDATNRATGAVIDREYSRLLQLYDININKQLYPYLDVRAGGLLELNDARTNTDGTRARYKERLRRYLGELNLNNPLYRAGFSYRSTAGKTEATSLPQANLYRQEYSGLWSWRPAGFPTVDLNYHRSHTYDHPRTRDATDDFLTIKSQYEYRNLSLDYAHTRNNTEEEISDSGALTRLHNAGVRYSTPLFDNRLSLTADSILNYRVVDPSGTGDVHIPTVPPRSEFFLLDDSNPAVNDPDEFTVVDATNPLTRIDLGPDGPQNLVSFGFEFASPTELDVIYVVPLEDPNDPTLASPAEISGVATQFSWDVYVSDDQEDWNLEPRPTVEYTVFEKRFEISLSSRVESRYVKIVTTPLSGGTTRKILVSRLQAFTTFAAAAGLEISDLDQNYTLGLRWQITDKTSATTDNYLKVIDSEPADTRRTRLTNSVSIRHVFSPIFVANARYLRSATTESEREDFVQHEYGLSIRGDYLTTFSQTLTYSGIHNDEGGESSSSNSLFLRNKADLYRDWSMNVDVGYSRRRPIEGGRETGTFLRIGTYLLPNPKLNFRLDYEVSWNTETGQPNSRNQTGNAQAFWLPLKTLSLFASVSFKETTRAVRDERLSLSQDYSINWAPFPDGSLNFFLRYSREKTTSGNDSDFLTPEIRWQIARGMLLTVAYSIGTVASQTETRDVQTVTGRFRVFY